MYADGKYPADEETGNVGNIGEGRGGDNGKSQLLPKEGRRAEVWPPGGGAGLRQEHGLPIHSKRRPERATARFREMWKPELADIFC